MAKRRHRKTDSGSDRPADKTSWAPFTRHRKNSAADKERSGSHIPEPRIPELPPDASDLHRRVELYEFQLRNLRDELEQIKLQAILNNLRAAEAPLTFPPPSEEDRGFDLDLFLSAYEENEAQTDPGMESLLHWARIEPLQGYDTHSDYERRRQLQPYTPPPADRIMRDLNLPHSPFTRDSLEKHQKRTKILEALIYHISRKLSLFLEEKHAIRSNQDTYDNNLTQPAADDLLSMRQNTSSQQPPNNLPEDTFSTAAAQIMAMEKRISELEAKLAASGNLKEENRCLEEKNDELQRQLYGFTIDIEKHFLEQTQKIEKALEERFFYDIQKQRDSLLDMGSVISQTQSKLREVQKEKKEAFEEIEALRKENERLRSYKLKYNRHEETEEHVESSQEKTFSDTRELQSLLNGVRSYPTLESFLRLRRFFLQSQKYEYGIQTYKELLDKWDDVSLLGGIYVLIGELFLYSGQRDEAEYYFSNQIINHNTLAQSLLRSIPGDSLRNIQP